MLSRTIFDHVLPEFLVVVLLRLSPRVAGSKIEELGIGRPRERMHLLLAASDREGLAALRRDQINLADAFIFVLFVFSVRAVILLGSCLAVGEKRDPVPIRRPLRAGVVSGLCQLNQRSAFAILAVKPEVLAENLLIPIRPVRTNDD